MEVGWDEVTSRMLPTRTFWWGVSVTSGAVLITVFLTPMDSNVGGDVAVSNVILGCACVANWRCGNGAVGGVLVRMRRSRLVLTNEADRKGIGNYDL